MKKPSPEVLNAVYRLRNDKDFALVMEWISESYEEAVTLLVDASAEIVFCRQGEARALREMKDMPERAEKCVKAEQKKELPGRVGR